MARRTAPSASPPRSGGRASTLRGARRWLLGALAALACSPWLGGGCSAPFDPPSLVNSMRVFAVVQDRCDNGGHWNQPQNDECLPAEPTDPEAQPAPTAIVGGSYAHPGDEVRMTMTFRDGYVDPDDPDAPPRDPEIVWLGGCFNPDGDQYFNCYEQLASVLEGGINPLDLPPELGRGATYVLPIPERVLDERPTPTSGPRYALGYVFFVVCAGRLNVVPPEGDGAAGSFPIGCFDPETNQRLGPESFIAGYTQVYAFEDERQNEHPPFRDLLIDGQLVSDEALDEDGVPRPRTRVERCAILEEDRRVQGCGAEDLGDCRTYDLSLAIPEGVDIAEPDPGAEALDGQPLTEAVWVDYYSDGGDLGSAVKLVNDAVEGYNPEHESEWTPPSEPGDYFVWAVVHDARGGASVIERVLTVE
ncbi:MAG: hypothetical protein WKG00_06605 [Polyangiaceae bacterium]